MKNFWSTVVSHAKQLFATLMLCASTGAASAQSVPLVCTDLAYISLDENCTWNITPPQLMEGGSYDSIAIFYVEIDKTLPLGNGPWVPPAVTTADIGGYYLARVTDPTTNNRCWGYVRIATELQCSGLTTINLDASGLATLSPADLQTTLLDNCLVNNQLTVTEINGLPSMPLNCANLGMSSINLTATSQAGHLSFCTAALLVNDPFAICDTCLVCPPSVNVTLTQAMDVLLPALQSGDLSVFDNYGEAEYLAACTFADSTYTVTYHPTGTDQSWFVRHWEGLDAAGGVLGACEQSIIFPFNQFITVSGHVFLDTLTNCLRDPLEQGTSFPKVVATRLPSNIKVIKSPDSDGAYNFSFNTHGTDSLITVEMQLPNGVATTCPNILSIPHVDTSQAYSIDFGIKADSLCPHLEINLETNFLRRCFTNTYFVNYSNLGFNTALNAFITIKFDTLFTVTGSDKAWTDVTNNTYTFPLGNVPAFSSGNFKVYVQLNCAASLGQTLCNTATIYPNEPCGTPTWTGPNIQTTARCSGDSVYLAILNTGAQDMTEALDFIVIEDIIMYRQDVFQLAAGDSVSISMAANGATWRIQAQQAPGNPVADAPSSSIEGCGGLNNPGLVNAFAQNDAADYFDRNCTVVTGSYDPNDKSAVPTGINDEHFIEANTDLEYKIRFQNTGTDTAFKVVIVDTLSQQLDFSSLQAGASSHPYRLNVFEGGILHFIFDPIMLPDSNHNESASHGFVSFRIKQRKDLSDDTQIQNKASIYFDFNDPVVTNTVLHTIGRPFVSVAAQEAYQPGVALEIQPNPFRERSVVRVTGYKLKQGLMTLYDGQGKVIQTRHFEGNECTINGQTLESGIYFLQVTDGGHSISSAKLMVR